jgi:hypothetical protein
MIVLIDGIARGLIGGTTGGQMLPQEVAQQRNRRERYAAGSVVKDRRAKAREQIYRCTNDGAKLVRMQSLPPSMRMDGAAMAKIDTSVRSSCEKMGKLDAGLVDGISRCAVSVQGEKKIQGQEKKRWGKIGMRRARFKVVAQRLVQVT